MVITVVVIVTGLVAAIKGFYTPIDIATVTITATPPMEVVALAVTVEVVAPSPSPAPAPAEVEMLARMIWGEARGVASDMEKAACVWCVLNRVDNPAFPDTVAEVLEQPRQFKGYSPDYPATEEHKAIAADVLTRWMEEQAGTADVGRVLPTNYLFFAGDGERNYFRTDYRGGAVWDWRLDNPYDS